MGPKAGAVDCGAPSPQPKTVRFQLQWHNRILWLSVTWVALCASLVHKYNELIGIFFAFIGSFLLAFILSQAPLDSKKNTPQSRRRHAQTKDRVGLVACAISFMFLGLREKGSGGFQALSMSTGFLAFNLWFTSMYCRPVPPPIVSMLEDALTVTIFLVSLSLRSDTMESYYTWIVLWVTYKSISFVIRLSSTSRGDCDSLCSAAPISGTTVEVSPRSAASVAVSAKDMWKVHGVDYDLTDFVNLHPGGKEAVLLARGRDCTALFESYHPFTNKHRYVGWVIALSLFPHKDFVRQAHLLPCRFSSTASKKTSVG